MESITSDLVRAIGDLGVLAWMGLVTLAVLSLGIYTVRLILKKKNGGELSVVNQRVTDGLARLADTEEEVKAIRARLDTRLDIFSDRLDSLAKQITELTILIRGGKP